jgi:hypothetical protein
MDQKLAESTIKTYLHSLKQLQEWAGFETHGIFDNHWLTAYFKGMKHAKLYESE